MILGVSHAVFATDNLAASLNEIGSRGYATDWQADGFASHSAKLPFLSHPHSTHNFAFARPSKGCPIELVSYRTKTNRDDIYRPIYSNGLVGAQLTATDHATAIALWTAFGFSVTCSDRGDTLLHFPTPVPAWQFRLEIEFDPAAKKPRFLDAPGFNCISLISTDLDRDRFAPREYCQSTGPFQVTINGKNLRVEIFQAPDGEFIELLQVMA